MKRLRRGSGAAAVPSAGHSTPSLGAHFSLCSRLTGCPGGAHSNLFADLADADTALSICLTAVSSLATLVTLPLWVLLAAAGRLARKTPSEGVTAHPAGSREGKGYLEKRVNETWRKGK